MLIAYTCTHAQPLPRPSSPTSRCTVACTESCIKLGKQHSITAAQVSAAYWARTGITTWEPARWGGALDDAGAPAGWCFTTGYALADPVQCRTQHCRHRLAPACAAKLSAGCCTENAAWGGGVKHYYYISLGKTHDHFPIVT